MMADNTNTRLDRIEGKLDQLAEAMVTLARAEEKLAGLKQDHEKSYERLNRFSQKLDEIEKKVDGNARTVQFINKLFWIVLVAAVGAISTNLWM